jgi:hypothetical protein
MLEDVDCTRRAPVPAADREAFCALYEASVGRVWAFATGRCRDRAGAEILTAAILERAFRQVDRPGDLTWEAFLFRVALEEARERGLAGPPEPPGRRPPAWPTESHGSVSNP